jgi:hypothetical protein
MEPTKPIKQENDSVVCLKKPYQKPTIQSEAMFESLALESAGKTIDQAAGGDFACALDPGS